METLAEQVARLDAEQAIRERDRLVRRRGLLTRLLADYGPRVRRADPLLAKDERYQRMTKAVAKIERKLDRLGLPWS